MLLRIDLGTVERCLEVVQLVRVALFRKQRRSVVVLESIGNRLAIVLKVEDEAIMLLQMCAVQPESVCTALAPARGLSTYIVCNNGSS